MKIFIRTEANQKIATGHMMRCLSIADAAREMGDEVIFIVAEEVSLKLPKERGYQSICLNHVWDDFDGEIVLMEQLIKDLEIQLLLVDSYYVTLSYMEAITRLTKTAYIDDLHAKVWPCSVLINYAVYCDLFPYQEEYPDTELLLGCEYMPLRNIYREVQERIIPDVARNILIVSGGSDEYHFMLGLTKVLLRRTGQGERRNILLICGEYNQDLSKIQRLIEEEKIGDRERLDEIRVIPSLPSLKEVLENADIVVTAGGTTLYEMAACRTPGICYMLADNQQYNVQEFSKRNLARYAGDIRKEFSYEQLVDMIFDLQINKKERSQLSENLKKLIDGKGAMRIAEKLRSLS